MITLEHWTLPPPAVALGALLAVHEYGRRRLARQQSDTRPAGDSAAQAWLLRAGIAWGVLTMASPLGYLSHTLLPARVALDLSFACVVAPLVVLGAPWSALAAAAGSALNRGPGPGRGYRTAVIGPVTAVIAYLGMLLVWQVPAVLDASVRVPALWWLQIACYLTAGVLVWTQLVGSYPYQPRWVPVRRAGLIATVLSGTWLAGVALVISTRVRYPAFTGGPLSPVMNQGLAGAITCVLPLIPLGATAFWCFSEWLTQDEDDGRLYDRARYTAAGGMWTREMPGTVHSEHPSPPSGSSGRYE